MSGENTSKLRKHMFHLVLITIAGAMIYGLPYFRSYFYDAYLETYNLTNTQMGTFGSMFGIFGMISYLFGGVVADMVSTRKLMSVSLVLTGIGGLLHLMHPNYVMLLGIYALWGFTSLFAFWPSLLKSLREIAGEDEQSKAYGFMDGGRGIVYAVDTLCFMAIFSFCSKKAGDLGGLNGVIIYYSTVAIVLGVVLFFLMKEQKPDTTAKIEDDSNKITLESVKAVVKLPAVWILSAILCCTYVMNIAFWYFTPYATSKFGMVATAGAFVTAAAQYVRPVAAFGGGALADKLGRSKVMYVTFSMMGIGTLLLAVMSNMSSTLFIILCLVIYAGMYGGYSMVFSMMEEGGVPIKVAGTAIGLVCTLGYLPEVVVPFCSGKLLDAFGNEGYRYLFFAIVVIMAIGICMLIVWDNYMKKVKAAQAKTLDESATQA